MKLLVVSYKVCWADTGAASGYTSYGGFPIQMEALTSLFDGVRLLILERNPPAPEGARPLTGQGLEVAPIPEPTGAGVLRKVAFIASLVRWGPRIWREVGDADAVHALVPGDMGIAGILVALARRKPLFVRHCGTWGDRSTAANAFLAWLLPRIAGGRVVVLATGGAAEPPEPRNSQIHWVFSSTLGKAEICGLRAAPVWSPGSPLRLVTVGRLSASKNARACIEALPAIRSAHPGSLLHIVGDGPERPVLVSVAASLGLEGAVEFHGNVGHEEVLDILSECHLFLFPTRVAEGFPKAVLEAIACGLPIVVPRVSVLPTLVRQGVGVLIDATDADTIAGAVLALCAAPATLESMARRGREVAARYTLEHLCDVVGERLRSAWGPLRTREVPSS